MKTTTITGEEYLRHERYYRRMMELYPDRFAIAIENEQEDIQEPPVFIHEEYISAEEAGEILGKSKHTIISYIKKGFLRGGKCGRWRVNKADVENFSPPKKAYRKKTDAKQRQKALERDGYKCQICGSTENLEVHHIKHREDGGTDALGNLVTLCALCHAEQHKGEPIHNLMASRLSEL